MRRKTKKYKEYLFVDGYNIINAWGKLKELSIMNLEAARDELIGTMAEYQHYSDIKVVIVFDAHMVKGNIGKWGMIKGVEVVYTKENETADQYIERTLDDIGGLKPVRVATSDWLEQQIVLGRGGTRISARELEIEILSQKKSMMRKKSKELNKTRLFINRLDQEVIDQLRSWKKKDN